jgi:hemerythrin
MTVKPPIWKIEWNDEMILGIPEIDEEHKRFASLINDFNRSRLNKVQLGFLVGTQ